MPRSPQAFSAPSKQMPGLNPKGDLNSIVSISASSTISTPSSEPSASKPRDNNPKREQNSRYRHNNGLNVLPAYTWYAAPSGSLTFVNKRTAEYLGVPKDHPLRFGIDIGAQLDDWVPLLHPDDREESRKYW